jgi:hypothetical protein
VNLLEKYKAMIDPQRQQEEETHTIHPLNVTHQTKTEDTMQEYIWRNPYPKGTPEARAESLRVIEAARRGEPIPYDETSDLPSSSPVVVNIPKTNPTPDNKTQPPAKGRAEWSPEIQALVDWFLKLEPREIKPFRLEPHIHVADPVQFFESLRREIETGPGGARAKIGTLQDDLRKLKTYLNCGAKR